MGATGTSPGMKYVEVAVDAPTASSRTFSYSIPDRFTVTPGQLVWVPFGRRVAQGVAMELADAPQVEVTRDILQPIEPAPLVSPVHLKLAKWLSAYYLSPLFSAVAPLLPPGFEGQVHSQVSPGSYEDDDLEALRPQTADALRELRGSSGLRELDFLKLLGRGGQRELSRLVQQGLVYRRAELPRPRIAPRYQSYLFRVTQPSHDLPDAAQGLHQKQRDLLGAVAEESEGYLVSRANKDYGRGVADALVRKGLLGREWVRMGPGPVAESLQNAAPPASKALTLTWEQEDALARILGALEDPTSTPRVFLLHGVTGSGKTEVYLRAIQEVVAQGRQAIFLIPEIALTPQTLHRVNARFPGRVAVLHSGLTPRQRFDQWWKIRDGHCDVVVGPRSAIFSPVRRLGLIVIDEEHEWTYKQEESQPHYHARTVGLELSRLTGAPLVLGSATPDVETYYRAQKGHFKLLELSRRVGPIRTHGTDGGQELAEVQVSDMRKELREGNRSIFSRALASELRRCVDRGYQAILFLNRRGSAPIVQCRDCGQVANCARCSVSLTYHSTDGRLWCHRCNRRGRTPARCRRCRGGRIQSVGVGTQRVVEKLTELLPGVNIARWDADATRAGSRAEDIMAGLNSGEIQVLVGTQLVAKGLDVPNVTLVAVVLADVGMYLPDFRAGERAFSLFCQVAGRAGRGSAPGKVFIQTYTPEHYAITAAAKQDYSAMFEREVQTRRLLGNPPFNRLVHLVYQDVNQTVCQQQAVAAARQLRQRAYAQGLTGVEIVGPAPGIPSRLRGRYRWHLVLRGRDLQRFLEGTAFPKGCTVDVDPVHLL